MKLIEIMDTTLRDGEQTGGVSFSPSEKLSLAQLLLNELKVDRVEVASARVSEGELEAVKKITHWAAEHGHLEKIEVLGFVDGDLSINWLKETGCKTLNLLTKGSLNHLKYQLKKTPEEHFADIAYVIQQAHANDITVNVYLEDWSNGMKNSPEYVGQFIAFLSTQYIKRIMLPDTLGILTPQLTRKYISEITTKYPHLHFDFHGHNDYDLGVANAIEAIQAGVKAIHLTINGMGERAGNVPLASIVATINDFMPTYHTQVNEKALYQISKMVESFSGIHIPINKPIVGENVFTQTAGIHADGDNKNNLYYNDLIPERFGRTRKYALGKTSGKANIEKNLQELGIELSDVDLKKVTQRIIALGDKKEYITADDLPYIISDVLHTNLQNNHVRILNYVLTHSKDLHPSATIHLQIATTSHEESAQGDGQYDAFMNALKKIYHKLNLTLPELIDYSVRIPPGGKTDALCETIITWRATKEFKTRGLDSDQTVSAIIATEKMLNSIQYGN